MIEEDNELEKMQSRIHDLYEKLSETGTITYIKRDTLNKWVAKYFNKDLISIDDLLGCIEDLDDEVENLKDKLKHMEQDIEDNYVSRPNSYYTGSSYDDNF